MRQGRVLWCDAEANCHRLASRENVAQVLEKAKQAKINTVVVDVKPLGGEVLYRSEIAPRLGVVKGKRLPESFDLLQAMIEEGRVRGISIHACMNVFSEGHRYWSRGPGFARPDWQVVSCEATWTVEFPSGFCLEINDVDIADSKDPASIYTSKSGLELLGKAAQFYVAIDQDRVDTLVAGDDSSGTAIPIPADGCVVALVGEAADRARSGVRVGDRVRFRATPVLRRAAESRLPSYGLFVNPIGPAREHELEVVREIAERYEIEGVVFDRMRYPNLHADFSDLSRESFERSLGVTGLTWPDDVFRINDLPWLPPVPGKYYEEWLEWRAEQIKGFAAEAASVVRSIKPSAKVGVYVGSWYDSYFNEGVNWGSREFHAGYSWMTPGYNRTGYAELFDYICAGCYYPISTRDEARAEGKPQQATVEAGCQLSREAIGRASFVYGSLYLLDYEDNPEAFERAIGTVLKHTDGVMLFDLVYLEDYRWWPLVQGAFEQDARAPHDA